MTEETPIKSIAAVCSAMQDMAAAMGGVHTPEIAAQGLYFFIVACVGCMTVAEQQQLLIDAHRSLAGNPLVERMKPVKPIGLEYPQ